MMKKRKYTLKNIYIFICVSFLTTDFLVLKYGEKNFKSEKKNVFQFTFNVKTNLLIKVIKNTNVTN